MKQRNRREYGSEFDIRVKK